MKFRFLNFLFFCVEQLLCFFYFINTFFYFHFLQFTLFTNLHAINKVSSPLSLPYNLFCLLCSWLKSWNYQWQWFLFLNFLSFSFNFIDNFLFCHLFKLLWKLLNFYIISKPIIQLESAISFVSLRYFEQKSSFFPIKKSLSMRFLAMIQHSKFIKCIS